MSAKVFFISDLHLRHRKIIEYQGQYRQGTTMEEHDEWIKDGWNSRVRKRDVVYVHGDVAFSMEGLALCAELNGHKKLILGNHDQFPIAAYEQYFKVLSGIYRYKKEFWLTHAPIHPHSLRDMVNIHGHVHHRTMDDNRYVNVSVEAVGGIPLFLDEIRERLRYGS